MRTPSRKSVLRMWYTGLLSLLLVPLVLITRGSAQSTTTIPNAGPQGSGWYIDRDPATTDHLFFPPSGDGARTAYAEDHLFVGWDGPEGKPEYISAVNFDLFQLGIPEGSRINSFSVTMIEHETLNPNARTHNTPNTETAVKQGIIICAAPTFISGQPGEALAGAPERDCSAGVTAVRDPATLDPEATPDRGHTYSWKFDITAMVNSLIQDEGAVSFTLEPKPAAGQSESWLLSFHNNDYKETDPTGAAVPKPGISAAISYTPPVSSDTTGGGGGGFEEFTEFTEVSDAPSFSDSGGLVEELAPEPEAPPAPEGPARPLAAGTFREGRVPFWDIPPFAWALITFSVLTLGASGWLLQLAPAAPRPPGAVSALMNGTNLRREQA